MIVNQNLLIRRQSPADAISLKNAIKMIIVLHYFSLPFFSHANMIFTILSENGAGRLKSAFKPL